MKAFKLVSNESGRLFSLFAAGAARVEYRVGQITEAPQFTLRRGYGLFAYTDKQQALGEMACYVSAALYEAEGIDPMPMPRYSAFANYLAGGEVVVDRASPLPRTGAIMFRAIRLIRLVAEHREVFVPAPCERWMYNVPVLLEPTGIQVCRGKGLVDLDEQVAIHIWNIWTESCSEEV